jgi:hypothetical protein
MRIQAYAAAHQHKWFVFRDGGRGGGDSPRSLDPHPDPAKMLKMPSLKEVEPTTFRLFAHPGVGH